jgi:hypothetical protein
MFVDTIEAAIGGSRSLARLNELAQDVWKAWGAGMLADTDAGRLSEAIEAQRRLRRPLDTVAIRAPGVPRLNGSIFGPKRRPRVSPDRQASMARRRRLAASGPMPPAIAARFTTGEIAVLRIVADEVRSKGDCRLFLGEIAARAGVGMTKARMAIRLAASDGLLTIQERRRQGQKNDANVLRVISREWMAWIQRGRGESPIASTNMKPTDRYYSKHGKFEHFPSKVAFRKEAERTGKRPKEGEPENRKDQT